MASIMDSVEQLHALADEPSNKNDDIFSDDTSNTSEDSGLTPRRLEMSGM
jgi:hypothetical protein